MARDDSPPDSPLSSMDTSDAYDEDAPDNEDSLLPPTKRIRIGDGSRASSAVAADVEPEPEAEAEAAEAGLALPDPLDGMSDVSSDTSGDVPSSPNGGPKFDDDDVQEQVTVCAWDGCGAGDLRNQDRLVEHIHSSHIETRQRKYTCEWMDCQRKGICHASGYALRAHMRKHTREKPFYCYLPECDRSFTRSDALAKHMRTVHETEALRPSDPIPKSMQSSTAAAAKSSTGTKLKIIIKTPQSHGSGRDALPDTDAAGGPGSAGADDGASPGEDPFTALTAEQGFSDAEMGLSLQRLFKICRRQLRWAEEEATRLKAECSGWEETYARLWREKEALFAQVMQSEMAWQERRQAILSGAADFHVPGAGEAGSAAVPAVGEGTDEDETVQVALASVET